MDNLIWLLEGGADDFRSRRDLRPFKTVAVLAGQPMSALLLRRGHVRISVDGLLPWPYGRLP